MATRRHPRLTMQRHTAAWQSTRQEPRITSESCLRPKRCVSCTAACMLVQPDSAPSQTSRPTRLPRWPVARSTGAKPAPKQMLPDSRTPRNVTNPRTLGA
eukprot:2260370-Pleurochrysis_carterae.AAC.1